MKSIQLPCGMGSLLRQMRQKVEFSSSRDLRGVTPSLFRLGESNWKQLSLCPTYFQKYCDTLTAFSPGVLSLSERSLRALREMVGHKGALVAVTRKSSQFRPLEFERG